MNVKIYKKSADRIRAADRAASAAYEIAADTQQAALADI